MIPYAFQTPLVLRGDNLHLAQALSLVGLPGSVRIIEKSQTHLTVLTPQVPRWAEAKMVLIRGLGIPTDTVPGTLRFVGPSPADTLVYEFRNASVDTLYQVLRWEKKRMPLKVYIPPGWPSEAQAVIWRGTRAWEGLAGLNLPSFIRVGSLSAADIVWRVREFPDCGGAHSDWAPGSGIQLKAYTTLCNEAFFPNEGDNHHHLLNIAVHETGHMLGIWRHSPRETDVMGGRNFTESGLSEGDIRTLRRLYELEPGFQPQPR